MTTAPRWLTTLLLSALILPLAGRSVLADEPAAPEAESKAESKAEPEIERVPLLWEVDTSPKIYLFGTIHIADERVLAHPPVVQRAMDASQALYTELDMANVNPAAMIKHVMLPEGESLKALLPEALYAQTDKLFSEKGMPLAMMDRLKVWAVWMQLQALEAPKPKPGKAALDAMVFQEAQAKEKVVGGLETVLEQISIFDNLSQEEQLRLLDEAVKATSKAREEGQSMLEPLTRAYLEGDADKIFKAMYESADMDDPFTKKLFGKLLDERNIRMVRRMLEKGQEHPDKTTFVAVGTAHYPGKMGIVNLLRKTGFRVRRLKTVADMERPWPAATKSRAQPVRMRRTYRRFGPFCIPGRCCVVPAR